MAGNIAATDTEGLFDRYVLPEPSSGCWLWTGADDKLGYGTITRQRKNMKAHQAFYEHFKGPVPAGLEIDHLCRLPRCVNPAHLEAVTHQENILRGYRARRVFQKEKLNA